MDYEKLHEILEYNLGIGFSEYGGGMEVTGIKDAVREITALINKTNENKNKKFEKVLERATKNSIDNIFMGAMIKVDHPTTCLNPDEYFKVIAVNIEGNPMSPKIYVRGENTCWFSTTLILDYFFYVDGEE